jgi:hypothetical protein
MKFRHSILIALAGLAGLGAQAQHGLGLQIMPEAVQSQYWQPANMAKGEFGTFRAAAIGSGWLQNSATQLNNVFGNGGTITEEAKANLIADVGDGALGNAGYQFQLMTNVRIGNGVWSFHVGEVNHNSFRLNNGNTLGLVLKGNYYYQDQTVSDSDIGFLHYRAREIGVGRSFSTESGLHIGVRAKFLAGHDAILLDHLDYSLYTAPDGIALDVAANYSLFVSDSAPGFFTTRGIGGALDIGAIYDINDKMNVGLSVIDAGIISWNGMEVSGDVNVHFEGVEIPSLFADSLAEEVQQSVDSLKALLLPDSVDGKFSTMTPMQVMARWRTQIGEKGALQATVVYSPANGGAGTKLPMLNVGYAHELAPGLKAGVSASGGGTTMYAVGAFAGYELSLTSAKLNLYLASDNILGVVTGNTKGLSVCGGLGVSLL